MKLTTAGKFWLSYFLFLGLLLTASTTYADVTSQSGSYSGAASQAGSQAVSGQGQGQSIDMGSTNVEAANLHDRAPGVFAAGVTAGGTNPCVVSIGAGLSVPGGGLNFANAYNDGECNVRETLRLMAAISSSAETGNQILLREIACQSATLWDAFERTYNATGDERYFCGNERPNVDNKFKAARNFYTPKPSKWVVTPAQNDSMATPYSKQEQNIVRAMLLDGNESDAFAMLMED